jgi:hypothetical protein
MTDAEKRAAPRVPASAVRSITGARISPHGADATIVNISASGLLAECTVRIQPGSRLTITFEGTFVPKVVIGRVARCAVASVGSDGALRYHIGVAFAAPIPLAVAPPTHTAPPPEPDPAPELKQAPVRNRW